MFFFNLRSLLSFLFPTILVIFFPPLRLFVCVRISQPAPVPQSPPSLRLLSLSPSPLSLRCPCVKCQTLLSGQRRRHLRCRRRQFPAVFSRPRSAHSALHSPLCPLFGGFICVGGKVSRRLVSPLFPCPFIPCSAHTILLCYVFCLFCIICCLCLPCGSPTSSAHKFYLYIFRYFATFVVVVHIL